VSAAPCERVAGAAMKTNFGVRIWRICHLKSLDHFALLIVFFLRRYPSQQFNKEGPG
jgi:hypothetical protein